MEHLKLSFELCADQLTSAENRIEELAAMNT